MLNETDILKILNEWNYWEKDFENFVKRVSYVEKIERARKTGEIVILTGVRRSGKSTLLKQEMQELSKNNDKKQFLYVNFEDSRFSGELNEQLIHRILEVYMQNINSNNHIFLFFDEIQEVKNWEKFVNTYYELKKATIFITGSTSKILSRELSTFISGRYIEIPIFPLSFVEFCQFKKLEINNKFDFAKNSIILKKYFREYINYGGFPKIVLIDEEISKKDLINEYFETILLRDVAEKNSIKNIDNLRKTANYILTNDGRLTNLNEIKKSVNISYEAVADYISFFKGAFFINEINSFDFSVKRLLKKNSKFYCIDSGIINISSTRFDENLGFVLENIVFNHLKRTYRSIFYLKEKNECDFIVKENSKIVNAIQCCFEITKNNKKREVDGLISAMDKFNLNKGLIITSSQEEELIVKNKKIKIIPAWKWLFL